MSGPLRDDVPDKEEFSRAFKGLSFAERREILRAANKGQTSDDPRKAALIASYAERRLRDWWTPLVGAAAIIGGFIVLSNVFSLDITWAGAIGGALGYLFVMLIQRPRHKAALAKSREVLGRGGGHK